MQRSKEEIFHLILLHYLRAFIRKQVCGRYSSLRCIWSGSSNSMGGFGNQCRVWSKGGSDFLQQSAFNGVHITGQLENFARQGFNQQSDKGVYAIYISYVI